MRIWGKIWESNHLLRDIVVTEDNDDTRTHKVFHALDEICVAFDLSRPIWLDVNIKEFKRLSKVHFYRDSFIEEIDFDCLELQVLEE